jgi:hypothetical protein
VRVKLTVLCFITFVLFINTGSGQSATGTVSGIVLDPSGGVIAGAEVLIINNATGVQYPGKANSEGYYVVPNIPPGTYRIQVSNSGFKTIIKPDIVIHVEDALAINFTLPIGAASEIVTVAGGAPLINTENASVSTVIDRNFVERLPLNGRSFNTLLQLTPGVVIAPLGGAGAASGQFSIAGQRSDSNNFSVDGVSANFGVNPTVGTSAGESGTGTAQAFSAIGGTSSLVSVDALQEFRVETSSFAPEFGRVPGGQVILTTRSGSNDFHGDVFDYFRNTVMDANDWFLNQAGEPRAAEHHNDFGGVLGGPIWKDRSFFFLSYEGARLDLPYGAEIEVPSQFARASAPVALAPFLNAYPIPNGQPASPTAYTTPFTGSISNHGSLDAGSVRIDHKFSDKLSIFGRYNDAPSQLVSVPAESSNLLTTTSIDTGTLTAGVNTLLTSNLANALRFNYSTQNASSIVSLDSVGGALPLDPSLLLGSLNPSQNKGSLYIIGVSQPLQLGPTVKSKTTQFDWVDDLSVTFGSHQAKFGADYRAIFLDFDPPQNLVGLTSFSLQDFISTGTVNFFSVSSYKKGQVLAQAFSLYAQDVWRINPQFTATYGLRWELVPPPSARGTTILAAWTNINDPAQLALAPQGTSLWKTTYGNLAPRFGIAYNLTPRGDLVFRAGVGIFYDLGLGSSADLANVFPNSTFSSFTGVSVPVSDLTPYLPAFSVQPPYPSSGIEAFTPNLKLPRSYQWNVAVEKSFLGKQSISVTYVGQAGRNLLRQEALFQPNANFSGEFNLTQNDARSNYNALQLQYRRPLSTGLQALLNYTWAHSLDNASNDVVAGPSNTVISAANDYASSDFDVRQSLSAAIAYDIPAASRSGVLALLTKHWSLDTVIVARTGFPFNMQTFSPSPTLGDSFTRPDLVPGQPIWLYGSACAAQQGAPCPGGKALNQVAFSIPSTIRQGTEGRNDIVGFGLTQVDLSIARKFPITERLNLQFRADAFNLLNHPNFSNPYAILQYGSIAFQSSMMLNQGLGGQNSLFQQGGPRSLQLSLKLGF